MGEVPDWLRKAHYDLPRQLRDRPTRDDPGGMECEACGGIFIGSEAHAYCNMCFPYIEGYSTATVKAGD